MKERSAAGYSLLLLRGMAMGAVDVIPGVSGGTIALITGIYEELIMSIRSFNARLLKTLRIEGIAAAWTKANGNFLVAVITGILISIFSLARLLSWLFEHHAMLVWAFFFGLIVGSAVYIGTSIKKWNILSGVFFLAGALIAWYVTIAAPATGPDTNWFVFVAGSLAFCAMVLPGISGAFILVLIGKYEFMLNAVKDLNLSVIMLFGLGGVAGVVAFSHVIGWLFKRYPNATLAMMTGFMTGSLNKLWPWKKVLGTRITTSGETVPLLEKNISPWHYAELFDQDPMIIPIVLLALGGMAFIFVFMISKKGKQ